MTLAGRSRPGRGRNRRGRVTGVAGAPRPFDRRFLASWAEYHGGMNVAERLTESLAAEIAATFPERKVHGAWLFGSHARGEARSDSDIDVGLLCDQPLDPVAVFDAGGRLAARCGMAVDLVDLRRAGTLLRVEATHRGRPLVPLDLEARLFATHSLADHAAFAPRRRAATRAFQERVRDR